MNDVLILLKSFIELISKKDSLLKTCSLILPGGLIYIFFLNLKEFTGSSTSFIIINSLLFIIIYWFFLGFKKELKLKSLRMIDYLLLNLNIKKDLHDSKKYCSELSYQYKKDSNKWIKDFLKQAADKLDSYESEYDKIISYIRSEQENINTNITTQQYSVFLLIIFLSFIFSMVVYYVFEFARTMNRFEIFYILFFLILLIIDYLKEVLNIIKTILSILFGKLLVSIGKIFLFRS